MNPGLFGFAPTGDGLDLSKRLVRQSQFQFSQNGAVTQWAALIPWDDTIPQIGEGQEVFRIAYTPSAVGAIVELEALLQLSSTAVAQVSAALFLVGQVDALAASCTEATAAANQPVIVSLKHFYVARDSRTVIFTINAGSSAGSTTLNGSAAVRRFGGVSNSYFSLKEYLP